ncbi:MAG: redox-regulated ATPase YchF [Thermoplasmata archaeon]
MEIGVVGKPNVGKSTFFSAATLAPAEIAGYPFTTIEPNRGVAYVKIECPHVELGTTCNPRNAPCESGTRLVPIELLDVAGLVPDAHAGRGLGNKFLDDLRQASALIHIVDASGGTDFEGNPCAVGEHDPVEDVKFLEIEISHWFRNILAKDWQKIARMAQYEGKNLEKLLYDKLTGLGISEAKISVALKGSELSDKPVDWSDDDLLVLARNLQQSGKPIILAANKSDISPEENIEKLRNLPGYITIPTSAEFELALRRAAKAGLIDYEIGNDSFAITDPSKLNEAQLKGLEHIQETLPKMGTTGIQMCIEKAAFDLLDLIIVFPVEDENKYTDHDGNVLPDAYLVPKGSTAKDLAYKVHTDLGDNFIRAIDARTKRVVGADHRLENGDVVTIVARA